MSTGRLVRERDSERSGGLLPSWQGVPLESLPASPSPCLSHSTVARLSLQSKATMVVMQQPSRIFAVCVVLLALCVGSRSVGCASLNEHGAGASTQRQKFSGGFPGITKAAQQMLSQGNSSFVTAAATAAGVQMMKRAISGLDLRYCCPLPCTCMSSNVSLFPCFPCCAKIKL